ncbi:MAG: hypothetical protein NTV54_07565 [Ignavibacteriales bacterium]|nr:hypothetical protein [Ignavibacteriales bacterium]
MRNISVLLLLTILLAATLTAQQSWNDRQQEAQRVAAQIQQAAKSAPSQPSRFSDRMKGEGMAKTNGFFDNARSFLMNGNQIVGSIFDYGGIGPGLGIIRHVNNMVWHGLGDVYQFGPLVVAEVVDTAGVVRRISSDAVYDGYARDLNPLNDQVVYGWKSIEKGYVDPSSKVMASSGAADGNGDGKPDSWPTEWYNPTKGAYVWPGYLRQDVPNADLEALWGMDDRYNSEYHYIPIPSDSTKRGLGVKIEGRALQWSNSLAQNCIFFVYTAQNFSEKDLSKTYFGMYGDVDVGGGSPIDGNESKDDYGFFISPLDTVNRDTKLPVPVFSRSIVYFWDNDGVGNYGLATHYDACKFLESPGNANNGIDDDGDGMIDESQTNGIDDNKNWSSKTDDVGLDGVPNTNDVGEGDGIPTRGIRLADGTLDPLYPGEPNFELTDLGESDQIGLTAFKSYAWTTLNLYDDPIVWQKLDSGFIDTSVPNMTDIIFLYGSGKISLQKKNTDGSIKRFSIAFLMGWNLTDLLITAQTVQIIYNQNYQFIRPPNKPIVTAVPGDRKVMLFWDSNAESSVDPILGKDFEGYVIYRSIDPQFLDLNTITDGRGTPLLFTPLKNAAGREAKWDVAMRAEPVLTDTMSGALRGGPGTYYIDVNSNTKYDTLTTDYWQGYAPMPYDQRGVAYYLGDNTGLVHSYVDSNNVINGQQYYYAVVSYDHGWVRDYPPTECTKRISNDPITSTLVYDVNTVAVIPGPRTSGYVAPKLSGTTGMQHVRGTATGPIDVAMLNDLAVKDKLDYVMEFSDSMKTANGTLPILNYSISRTTPLLASVTLADTNFVKIGNTNIIRDSLFRVTNSAGTIFVEGRDYVIDIDRGVIRKTNASTMSGKGPFTVQYRYYGLLSSSLVKNEEANPIFDGIRISVLNHPLALDTTKSAWFVDKKYLKYAIKDTASFGVFKLAPLNIELQFTSSDTLTDGTYARPGDTLLTTAGSKKIVCPFRILNVTADTVRAKIKIDARINENVNATKGNNRWDPGEYLAFLTPAPYRTATNNTMIGLTFSYADTTVKKFGGEVFEVVTQQPFSSADRFTFTTEAAKFSPQLAASSLDKIKVVPNPYLGLNEIEPNDRLEGATRGSRRIYFEHLPTTAIIRIYTLSGELVQTIHHESSLLDGREFWNLLNRDNLSVAYGVYIAHIEAPGVGERILKFALIK